MIVQLFGRSFGKHEWLEFIRDIRPELTDAEYEEMWARFERGKRQIEAARSN